MGARRSTARMLCAAAAALALAPIAAAQSSPPELAALPPGALDEYCEDDFPPEVCAGQYVPCLLALREDRLQSWLDAPFSASCSLCPTCRL